MYCYYPGVVDDETEVYKEVDIHVRLEQSVAVVGFTQQSLLCRKNYCAFYFL